MTLWTFIGYSALAVFLYMTGFFIAALIKKDNSIVDIGWGPGFILVAVLTFFLQEGWVLRHWLVTGLVIIWGFRLAVHIALRNWGRGEDKRYARWRREWGKWLVPRSFVQIFLLQAILLIIISYSIILVNHSRHAGLTWLDAVGALIWCIGFSFEAAGDYQLVRFRANPENRGKIMQSGLWRYTRHPNYFGESMMWWGLFIIALNVAYGWTAVVSPLVITLLLLKVSGVGLLEKSYSGNPEYQAYARRTNAFIPWFPKK
jgi:steroid 5-alpha reductase family enzyme